MAEPPPYPPGKSLLEGKTVLVTAAAGAGIGFATAKRCVEEGAKVVVSDKHERRLVEASDQLAEIGKVACSIPCDVTSQEDVDRLFRGAIEATGGLDVVVNNAGLGGTKDIAEMTDDEWSVVLDISLERDVPLHARGAAAHDPAQARGDREPRLDPRAGARRPARATTRPRRPA